MQVKSIKAKGNYFKEKEMIELVKEYQKRRDNDSFKKIQPGILSLIDGMITKQFSYNHHIQNSKKDAIIECFMEILKALDRYDPDKGRLFAYMNRIAKNTLMKYYRNSRKIKDREQSYTDIIFSIDDPNVDVDNVVLASSIKNLDLVINETSDLNSELKLNPSPKNVTLTVEDTCIIIYKYLRNLKETLLFYIHNPEVIDKLIEDIRLSPDVNFDFTNKYNETLVSEKMFYFNLISSLQVLVDNILLYLEKRYAGKLSKNENDVTYNGRLSPRMIGYVRKITKTKLKKENLARYYDVDDLVYFINFLIERRYVYDE